MDDQDKVMWVGVAVMIIIGIVMILGFIAIGAGG